MMFDELVERLQTLPADPPERDMAVARLAKELEIGLALLFRDTHVPHANITGLVLMRMGLKIMLEGGITQEELVSELRERVEQHLLENRLSDETDELRRIVYATDLTGSGRLN